MTVAIFGLSIDPVFYLSLNKLIGLLKGHGVKIFIYKPFMIQVASSGCLGPEAGFGLFTDAGDLPESVSYLFSIGGDGTFLQSVLMLKGRPVPVVGINSGRLGFLSSISWDEIEQAVDLILKGRYNLEERSLLEAGRSGNSFDEFSYALNEVTITKMDNASMIRIHTWLNDEFLTTYWADGLIVSTPTGSTAYSLSVGGPILTPDSKNIIIAPIASHNLTMRPIVVPDHYRITLRVEGRGQQFLMSLDRRARSLGFPGEIQVTKADFSVRTVKLNGNGFFHGLRSKLMWGADRRN